MGVLFVFCEVDIYIWFNVSGDELGLFVFYFKKRDD